MRQMLAITVILYVLLPQPVRAQDERTLIDAVILVVPNMPQMQCLDLDPGQLRVTLAEVGEANAPVSFGLTRNCDPDWGVIELEIPRQEVAFTRATDGGLHCYTLTNPVVVPPDAGLAQIRERSQFVLLRMTLAP